MHDILIVTSRNVVTSGGEFSLIKNRADALKNGWGIESDIAALCNVRLGVSRVVKLLVPAFMFGGIL